MTKSEFKKVWFDFGMDHPHRWDGVINGYSCVAEDFWASFSYEDAHKVRWAILAQRKRTFEELAELFD